METAISLISQIPTTKQQADTFASILIEEVEEGNKNPLELHIQLTALQKAIDTVKKAIADGALTEANKYGTKIFEKNSAEVAITELGPKYDFVHCGDPLWDEATKQEKGWADKRKERETFLKTIKTSMDIILEGEPLTVLQPIKSSTTGLKITLK